MNKNNLTLNVFNELCRMRGITPELVHRVIIDLARFCNYVIWGELEIKTLKTEIEYLKEMLKTAKKEEKELIQIAIRAKNSQIREIEEILDFSKNFTYDGENTIYKWVELFLEWYKHCYGDEDEN